MKPSLIHRLSLLVILAAIFMIAFASPIEAQITNPSISAQLGQNDAEARSGVTFVRYFVSMWGAIISVGGVLVLVYFLWAGIEWITAGGDSGKVGKARDKMTQSIIGLVILVSSTVIIGFISRVFFGDAFNILRPTLPNNINVNFPGGGGSKP